MENEILAHIPHRPPFLLVDRIVEQSGNMIKTQKQVHADEPWFQGHYPGNPIMPGVLICESIFQSGAVLMAKLARTEGSKEFSDSSFPVITRINNVKLRHAVVPGDLMEMEVTLKEKVGPAWYLTGLARVRERTVLTLEFTAMHVKETT
jgi:3-hydroxyacyl-[acyl-carrier-protein] dehydratase